GLSPARGPVELAIPTRAEHGPAEQPLAFANQDRTRRQAQPDEPRAVCRREPDRRRSAGPQARRPGARYITTRLCAHHVAVRRWHSPRHTVHAVSLGTTARRG